jgi:hypothetical protein
LIILFTLEWCSDWEDDDYGNKWLDQCDTWIFGEKIRRHGIGRKMCGAIATVFFWCSVDED